MSAFQLDGERHVYTVGELLAGVRHLLEERVGRVWVLGEVSDLFRAASGHVYFTLKDAEGQIRAAFFRSAARRAAFELEEGLEVLVYGDATVYQPRGDLQLVVRAVEPRGVGALQLAFEQLRRRLEAEGLFDPARKRTIPRFPRRVALVTSAEGAALRDVIEVSRERFPAIPILVASTRVQGEGAELEIATALDAVARQQAVEVVLLVRGGGSLEDLWCFNSEIVARAVARCPVPVVTGVGHEIDFTIADAVADARAPTPSAAAAMVFPDRQALRVQLGREWERLVAAGRALLERVGSQLVRERDALRVLAPSARVAARRTRLVALGRALMRSAQSLHQERRMRFGALVARLDSLSPLAVLSRGYALVRTVEGAIVRRAEDVTPGQRLAIQLAEADLEAAVERVRARRRGPEPSSS